MAECSSSVCAICYRGLTDARLLDCLHTFCKTCLEDLDVRTGHAHEISCPLCRRKTRLPDNGASSLPKDITVGQERNRECHACKEDGKNEPDLWCTTCHLAVCKDHVVAHVMANSDHSIKPFPEATGRQNTSRTGSAYRHCEAHGRPLEYFCKQCKKAVCGECAVLGEHHGHKPIVAVKEIAKDLKQRVLRKMDMLKAFRLPCVQRASSTVDKVTTELSSRAEQVRMKIRSSRKSVLDAVELLFEQKLAEVDDLEEARLKHLGFQKDELKVEDDCLKSVLRFAEKVLEVDVETEGLCDLLFAVDKRADELEKAEVEEQPVEHACLDFEMVSENELLAKASALVGVVIARHASATHSFAEGETEKACPAGSSVNFLVVAKDKSGRRLSKGGDLIQAEVCQTEAEVHVDVLDKTDGTYMISVTAYGHGEYLFDVFVNNIKLHQRLSISCQPTRFTFDPSECQADSTVSEEELTVTHTGRGGTASSVLSRKGMTSGEHVWKVNVTSNRTVMVNMLVGVGEKPGITANTKDNYKSVYGWYGDGNKCILGKWADCMGGWKNNDVLQFHLNCTKSTLTITNFRSGETSTITDLPPTELFAYFRTYRRGQSFTLLQ